MDEDKKEVEYIESTWPEFGVAHHWKNAKIHKTITTEKGTVMEMIERPNWGMACYMNGEIQSCLADERIYHESLVHPAMVSVVNPRRVLIVGGGEGATAREVLKWRSVECVDMYEWDKDVLDCFQLEYREWANGAWEDPRLRVHYKNIFEVVENYPEEPYDVIIIDLFEPVYKEDMEEKDNMWVLFHRLAFEWLRESGSITMYSGIRNHFRDIRPVSQLFYPNVSDYLIKKNYSVNNVMSNLEQKELVSYKVFIPSYSGEAMFILGKHQNVISKWNNIGYVTRDMDGICSHLSEELWRGYCMWNQY